MFLLGPILFGTLCASWTWLTISFSMLGKFSHTFSCFFFFPSGTPYNSNVGVFDTVPEVSETILGSFHSFYFILLFRSYFLNFIFSSLTHSSASDILWLIPSRVFLISVIMLSVSICLFFISSRSLLIESCIFFPFCFQGFWSSLLSLFWILFQVVCVFPLHLFGLLCF